MAKRATSISSGESSSSSPTGSVAAGRSPFSSRRTSFTDTATWRRWWWWW
ncbi:unnamed protein product [Spirodela intermedia]|uniref:Uncharacterized protein n=1 Tax=Spirodela intermedia TaxID=51605 RepID=A0A7I8KYY1_SPIIN|nr:unnamed protein product [Spirodela intermedia]